MRTMNEPTAKAMLIECEEHAALVKAEEVLRDVQFSLGGDNTIMSLETGEVIAPGELARARAILEFIATHRMVAVNP